MDLSFHRSHAKWFVSPVLEERTVAAVHRYAGLPLLDTTCPHAQDNLRERYREALRLLAESVGVRALPRRVVRALENLDAANLWRDIEKKGCRPPAATAPHGIGR